MISFIPRNSKTIEDPEKFYADVRSCRHKDTPYAIVQLSNRSWLVYVISSYGVYLTNGYHSKREAVKAVESGVLEKEFVKQYAYYSNVLSLIGAEGDI